MKNLLLIILFSILLTNLKAQDADKAGDGIIIDLQGDNTWVETNFNITIKQKGSDILIRYAIKEGFDRPSVNKDSIIKALRAKYKDSRTNPEVEKKLIKEFEDIRKRSIVFYKDSIIVTQDISLDYKLLLKFIADADAKKFEGGPFSIMDSGTLSYKVTNGAKTINIEKSAPLSLTSPLLYTFLKETLIVGRKANSKTALKIDEMFNYFF